MYKRLLLCSIDDSVYMGEAIQKLLMYKRLLLYDNVEKFYRGRPYPRTEAPGV